MSSSSDSFRPKHDQNEITLKNSSPPISNCSNGYSKQVSYQNLDQVQENQEQEDSCSSNMHELERVIKRSYDVFDQEIQSKKTLGKTEVADNDEVKRSYDVFDQEIKSKLGKSEVADEDEGFRTPTSLDRKIPEIPIKCPPAPKKPLPPLPPPCSRKRNFLRRRNIIKLDMREIESLFPSVIRENFNKKIKKCQKD